MRSPLLVLCVCQSLLSVSYGATLKAKANDKHDVEETELYQLKPKVPIGQFLGNPEDLGHYENTAPSVQKLKNKAQANVDVVDETEAEEDESLNDLLKTVLITLRDHPDIIMNILEDEERRKNKDFQEPSEQLALEPKRVQKKGGNGYETWGNSKEESHSSQESQENRNQSGASRDISESRDGSYYKNKYDTSAVFDENSDDSKELDLAQYYKQKYANSKSKDSSSSSSSSASSSSSSEENKQPAVPLDKRVPEQPEETIDITSLPDEDDLDLTKIISEGGLEDLPEYKGSLNKIPEPSKLLKADRSAILGKVPKFLMSAKANGRNASPTATALKPVITEADMSPGNMENSGEADKSHKASANEKIEKTKSQQTSEQKS